MFCSENYINHGELPSRIFVAVTIKKPATRGRPRRFDPEAGLAQAQALFHARGYDGVTVADLTDAMGINPPSFYAAFGSKAALFERALGRYAATDALPLATILQEDRPAAEALAALLAEAARRYTDDPAAPGCMVLEGARCGDDEARAAAARLGSATFAAVRHFLARRHPGEAARLADYVAAIMAGMSAAARAGWSRDRLLAVAELAGGALRAALPA